MRWRFLRQLLLKINFAFNEPKNKAAIAADMGQYESGFKLLASSSREPPFRSNTIPPLYHTRAMRIFRVVVEAVNADDLLFWLKAIKLHVFSGFVRIENTAIHGDIYAVGKQLHCRQGKADVKISVANLK